MTRPPGGIAPTVHFSLRNLPADVRDRIREVATQLGQTIETTAIQAIEVGLVKLERASGTRPR